MTEIMILSVLNFCCCLVLYLPYLLITSSLLWKYVFFIFKKLLVAKVKQYNIALKSFRIHFDILDTLDFLYLSRICSDYATAVYAISHWQCRNDYGTLSFCSWFISVEFICLTISIIYRNMLKRRNLSCSLVDLRIQSLFQRYNIATTLIILRYNKKIIYL